MMNYTPWRYPQQHCQWRSNGPRPRGSFHPGPRSFSSIRPSNVPRYHGVEEHWCETCDRGFKTADLLNTHKSQHQKCNVDGCQFIAHPNIITKHIQMQHSSGLYKKIANLNNPEEIKKWIDERKKRFPTKANIEKKAAELQEKIERGEKMALKHNQTNQNQSTFHTNQNYKQGYGKRRFSNENQKKQNYQKRKCFKNSNGQEQSVPSDKLNITNDLKHTNIKKKPTIAIPLPQQNKLLPFKGIQDIIYDSDDDKSMEYPENDFHIEDDDEIIKTEDNKIQPATELTKCGALSSLMCNYGSSVEEESNTEKITPIDNSSKNCKAKMLHVVNDDSKVVNENKIEEKKISGSIVTQCNSSCTKDYSFNCDIDSDNCSPEETKILKELEIGKPENKPIEKMPPATKKLKEKIPIKTNSYRKSPKIPSTLLQKLLSTEIRKERNIVLQCIRYVINNNYFEK